ncbi:MAG: phosphomannomutase/phosphoglucomutase [Lachnospiraceae bacterium]|nr:phosphomannomutase/phosphoglucomutase [Lachnospiraceae bacterium]
MNNDNLKRYLKLQNGSDVRGIAITSENGEANLHEEEARTIAHAFVGFLANKCGKKPEELKIGIGHDSRLSADWLAAGAAQGFITAGAKAYDCGLVSTPSMFLSTVLPGSDFDGAVMITASHMPSDRNGLKFFSKASGLEHDEITDILTAAADNIQTEKADVKAEPFDLLTLYCEHQQAIIKKEVEAEDYDHPLKGLHIVVDAGNGAAGFFASRILEPLGADTEGSVYLDPDGHFPNHIPNPEDGEAMAAVKKATLDAKADLGVIFDCDGDRGAVVLEDGEEANRNTLIALLSAILVRQHPGTTIVTDSVTSDELAVFLEKGLGLKHLRFKRGYKNVIDKGIELNAAGQDCQLAIETSGHGALKENYFSDDGAYLAVKIICEMARMRKEGRNVRELIADLEQPADAAEIRFKIAGDDFKEYGLSVLEGFKAFAEADSRFHIVEPNYEGIRIAFDDEEVKGWVLLRMSLHEPKMPMNLEAKAPGGTKIILDRIRPFFAGYDRLTGLN